jgi:hypothetical protein
MPALALVGMAVQPGLGLFTQVAMHRMSGNHEKVKEMQKALADPPNDFRCEPARWLLASGIRSQHEPVLAAFEQDPVDMAEVDPKFREAFRAWLDDLSRSGSPLLVVKLQEDVDAKEPASAKVELMIWQNDPTLKRLNWTGKHDPLRPKAFADLPEGFEDKALDDHRKAVAAALKKQFGALLSDKLADWKSERDAGTSKAPTIALHGRYKHSGTFVKMGERGHFDPLTVMPAVSWDIKLYDRRDKLLGETTITNLVDKDFNWKQMTGPFRIYGHLGSYDAVLSMVYGRTAWEVMRRTGLDAGPPPTVFP